MWAGSREGRLFFELIVLAVHFVDPMLTFAARAGTAFYACCTNSRFGRIIFTFHFIGHLLLIIFC